MSFLIKLNLNNIDGDESLDLFFLSHLLLALKYFLSCFLLSCSSTKIYEAKVKYFTEGCVFGVYSGVEGTLSSTKNLNFDKVAQYCGQIIIDHLLIEGNKR